MKGRISAYILVGGSPGDCLDWTLAGRLSSDCGARRDRDVAVEIAEGVEIFRRVNIFTEGSHDQSV
jgi:hypothetical protein